MSEPAAALPKSWRPNCPEVADSLPASYSCTWGCFWPGYHDYDLRNHLVRRFRKSHDRSRCQTGGWAESILLLPWYYVRGIGHLVWQALTHPSATVAGDRFSASLLAILTAHEFGHYFFCRYYGVDATLPFFIPQPPGLLPGTFGAFIKMKSPVGFRDAPCLTFGLAGPLAGFIVIVPIAFAGVLTLQHGQTSAKAADLVQRIPLLFRLIARTFKKEFGDS